MFVLERQLGVLQAAAAGRGRATVGEDAADRGLLREDGCPLRGRRGTRQHHHLPRPVPHLQL